MLKIYLLKMASFEKGSSEISLIEKSEKASFQKFSETYKFVCLKVHPAEFLLNFENLHCILVTQVWQL